MAKKSDAGRALIRGARQVLKIEAESILDLGRRLNDDFTKLVRMLSKLRGKVVVSGVGKSGLIGAKIAATLSSTGTPAVFLDPLNALHGDLGVVSKGDVLLCLSNSGESAELINVIHAARPLGAKVVALTGNISSTLAREADRVVDVGVKREACPLGLAPTASSTALLAFGDALAMALASAKHFTEEDYAARHPGGQLGQRLKLRVADLMRTGKSVPAVAETATVADTLREMTERDNLGVAAVVANDRTLVGIVTDGDLRRMLLSTHRGRLLGQPVSKVMTPNPKCIDADAPAADALRMMELKGITSLLIVDVKGRPAGIILLHDILGRGQFNA
ncbi:MAG: KpsF/GutQ family sugar-phosphate isomerase [Planctomycetota bacterium]